MGLTFYFYQEEIDYLVKLLRERYSSLSQLYQANANNITLNLETIREIRRIEAILKKLGEEV